MTGNMIKKEWMNKNNRNKKTILFINYLKELKKYKKSINYKQMIEQKNIITIYSFKKLITLFEIINIRYVNIIYVLYWYKN